MPQPANDLIVKADLTTASCGKWGKQHEWIEKCNVTEYRMSSSDSESGNPPSAGTQTHFHHDRQLVASLKTLRKKQLFFMPN